MTDTNSIIVAEHRRASGLATTMHVRLFLLFSTVLFHEVACYEVSTCLCVKPKELDYNETYNPCSTGECNTLMYYARDQENFTNDTILEFLPGNHLLTNMSISVKGVVNFTLAASNESLDFMPTVQCGGTEAGFWFEDVHNLTIRGLKLQSCGFPHAYNSNYSQALRMVYVTNMNLSNVFIKNSSGYGIYIYNSRGYSVIQDTVIDGSQNTTGCYGGNIRLMYTNSSAINEYDTYSLVINNSLISNGNVNVRNQCHRKVYATGLGVFLATNNRIELKLRNVTFTGNKAHNGGNVAITYIHLLGETTWKCVVTIDNCTLSNGSAEIGGGLYLSVVARQNISNNRTHPLVDIVTITDTIFENNEASVVGGGAYILSYEDVKLSTGARITIKNSTFLGNTIQQCFNSLGGVALNIFNYQVAGYIPHQVPQYTVSITSCLFMNNSADIQTRNNTFGSAALFIEEITTTNLRDNHILNNHCTGIVAIRSGLALEGTNTIFNNTGNNGGGLVLCDNSIIYFNDTVTCTVLNISNNTAWSYGGGIYTEFGLTQDVPPCFFQFRYRNNKSVVHLENNVARIAGGGLYGGSIDHCFFFGYDNPKNSTDVFLHLFHFTNKNSSYITSYPLRVCFCSEDKGNLYHNCTENVRNHTIYPGGFLTVPVATVGQMNGLVPGYVLATNVAQSNASQSVPKASCSNLTYSLSSTAIEQSLNAGNKTVNIHLTVQNYDYKEIKRVTISVNLDACPLGFQDSCKSNNCGCTCIGVLTASDGIVCDIKTTTIYKKRGSQIWFGFGTTTDIVLAENCPFDYCNRAVTHRINVTQPSTANKQCAFHRAGVLCGGCGHNLSLVFGSSRCSDCSNTPAWSCIFLVMAFLLAGVCLVLFIGVIDMTVTEGTLNAIIFYMNVACVNRATIFGYSESPIVNFLMVFVTWMNLDLGINVCFYNGMSAFAKATFQFMFPLYLWFIAAVVIILCRFSSLLSKLLGRNGVKVLATIILLSYAKLIRAAIDAIYHSTLTYSNSSGTNLHYSRVWRLDGNMPYWSKKHIILLVFCGNPTLHSGTAVYPVSKEEIQCEGFVVGEQTETIL